MYQHKTYNLGKCFNIKSLLKNMLIMLNIAAHRRGFWEMKFLNSVIYGAVHNLPTRRRCWPVFASRSRMSGSARELRRSNRLRLWRAGGL